MRIVSLLPSVTETLFAIGAGDRIVGVTHECDYPPEARALPALTSSLLPEALQTHLGAGSTATLVAGRAQAIDRHVRASVHSGSSLYALDDVRLAALDPDLIVTQELCEVCAVSYEIVDRAAKRLRGDPRVVSLEPSSLDDVYANIATLGNLAGAADGARDLIASLTAREAALRARVHTERPRTLVLEWTDPAMSGGHWTPGLVELAGGTPVLANPGGNSQRIAWDAIAGADPDVVIVAPCGYDLAHARAAVAELATIPEWRALRAVQSGRAYVMDGNAYVNRPGPRLIDTAEIFASAIGGNAGPASAIEPIAR
jgi:iron complex transport system substrate-binding protein